MSDTSGSGFSKFVPGFEFLQNLAGQAAGGVAQGIGNSIPQLPNLGSWVAPTFNVEDLEKRIEELKAVHFWLDQNSKALGATIQALEVQKMTLATLKNMNFSLGDVANALKIKATDAMAGFTGSAPAAAPAPAPSQFAGLEIPPRTYGTPPEPQDEADGEGPEDEAGDDGHHATADAPAPEAKAPPKRRASAADKAAAPAPSGVVDPMQWWGALSQQFQNIATNALKDVARQSALDTTRQVATGLTEQAVKTATGMAGKAAGSMARNVGHAVRAGKSAARAVTGGQRPADRSTARSAAPKSASKAAPKAAPKATRKAAAATHSKANPKAATAAPRKSAMLPFTPGDWTLPTALFPGFQSADAPAQQPTPKARKAPAKKAATAKTAAPAAKTRRR